MPLLGGQNPLGNSQSGRYRWETLLKGIGCWRGSGSTPQLPGWPWTFRQGRLEHKEIIWELMEEWQSEALPWMWKMKDSAPQKRTLRYLLTQSEHFRLRKPLFNTSNLSNILSEIYLPGTNGLSHLTDMNNVSSLSGVSRDLIEKMNLMCSSLSGT